MSKIIGLDGAPISRSTNNAVEGENLVECVIELSDIENLRKAKPIQIQTPNGVVSIPPERMLPELLGQLFQFMNATEQKQLTVTITDKSSKLVLEKQIQMRLAHKPMSDDPDLDIFYLLDKWQREFVEKYEEKYKDTTFISLVAERLNIDELESANLINRFYEPVKSEKDVN